MEKSLITQYNSSSMGLSGDIDFPVGEFSCLLTTTPWREALSQPFCRVGPDRGDFLAAAMAFRNLPMHV